MAFHYTHIIQGNSWLLVVESLIDILTPGLSFNHNLCFKYSNRSCELVLDIYISRAFQWYNKKCFNSISFDPWNHSLNIRDFIRSPFRSVWADSFTFFRTFGNVNVISEVHFQLAPFHAFALVVSQRLRSWLFCCLVINFDETTFYFWTSRS